MKSTNLVRNILLAFIFFFIGRVIVSMMGNIGLWVIGGLVIVFYAAWYFKGWKKSED